MVCHRWEAGKTSLPHTTCYPPQTGRWQVGKSSHRCGPSILTSEFCFLLVPLRPEINGKRDPEFFRSAQAHSLAKHVVTPLLNPPQGYGRAALRRSLGENASVSLRSLFSFPLLYLTHLFSITFLFISGKYLCFHRHSRFFPESSKAVICFHRHSRFVRSILWELLSAWPSTTNSLSRR